jgi:hypothetical protein
MAPRNQKPTPQEVHTALAYLIRAAHAHAVHAADIEQLKVISTRLSEGKRLTRQQASRVREAQAELLRFWKPLRPKVSPEPKAWEVDRELAVSVIRGRRIDLRDRHAASALRAVVAAGSQYAAAYRQRAMEARSVQVFEAMKGIYEDVRRGLSTSEEERRIRSLFRSVQMVLSEKHLKRLLRTAEQIAAAGGPSDCALETVGFVFGKGGTTLREQRKRPQLPAGLADLAADVAFAQPSNMVKATAYVVGLLGWEVAEVEEFHALAEVLFAISERPAKDAFTVLPRTHRLIGVTSRSPKSPVRRPTEGSRLSTRGMSGADRHRSDRRR